MPSQLVGELSAFLCVFPGRVSHRLEPELGENPLTAANLVLEQFEHMGSLGRNGGVLPCVGTPRPASPCTEPAALRDDMVH